MDNKFYIAENGQDKIKNINSSQKSLNNYINQLKLHFDLTDKDIVKVLEFTLDLYKFENNFFKKWWHILK